MYQVNLLVYRCLIIGLLLTSLAGCGGGGGGGGGGGTATPPAPTLTLTPTATKVFRFTWADVAGETEYRLLENPDGASGYTEVATIAADVTVRSLVVSLPKRINARYILQACNSAGCSDSTPVLVSGTLANAVGYVKASNTGSPDKFGYAVAISANGSTLAVGATGEASGVATDETDNTAPSAGAVYVFTRSGSAWTQQAYLKRPTPQAGEPTPQAGSFFGAALALSADGNTLAVGSASYVDVFTRSGTVWTRSAGLRSDYTISTDAYGSAVALSADGNTLAVGAWGESSAATGINGNQLVGCDFIFPLNCSRSSGAVYVYARTDTGWSQTYIKASNTAAYSYFGTALTLSADGGALAVGAPGEGNLGSGSGAVYVFARAGAVWSQQSYVKAANAGADDHFGNSVALSGDGNTLAVGASREGSNATGINGNMSNDSALGAGAVYVLSRTGATWSQQAYLKASNTESTDNFGTSVAISTDGNTLAVGAPYEDSNATGINGNQADNSAGNAGAVYFFTRSVGVWNQKAYVKASNSALSDYFGYAVGLSGDGNTLAVGAYLEDSNATGINGNQGNNSVSSAGAVYLY